VTFSPFPFVLFGHDVVEHVFDVFDAVVVAVVFVELAIAGEVVEFLAYAASERDGVQFLHDLRGAERAAADLDFGVAFVEQFLEEFLTVDRFQPRFDEVVDDPFGAVFDADAFEVPHKVIGSAGRAAVAVNDLVAGVAEVVRDGVGGFL